MTNRTDDAARRVADTYALHRIADEYNSIGKWFAVKLADGESDGVLYDSKRDAVTHQKHMEMYYAYVQVGPWQMTVDDAAAFLKLHRAMYSKGVRLADRDHKSGGKDMIRRISRTDQRAQVRGSLIGDTRPTNIIHGGS